MKYEVDYIDPITGAKSAIDNIDAADNYTAEDYIRDCKENADDDWNEMLSQGTVEIIPVNMQE